ncbi:uncharacterized protein MYCFIDRAFT_139802, partial [Pseudocercospora fijiensis CIRAD86]
DNVANATEAVANFYARYPNKLRPSTIATNNLPTYPINAALRVNTVTTTT